MKKNIPPWPKLATVQYWILSLILYLISIFALFAVPYPQFSNGMAALKCSPHFRNHNHILAHLGLFSLCFATEWDWKSYLAQIQLVMSLLYPITGLSRLTRPRHGRLLTGRHSTLYTMERLYMEAQVWLKTTAPTLFLNLFFHFLPAAALCDDFSLVDSVET